LVGGLNQKKQKDGTPHNSIVGGRRSIKKKQVINPTKVSHQIEEYIDRKLALLTGQS